MRERLADLASEHARLERDLADPAVHADQDRARTLGRRYSELTPIVSAYTEWRQVGDDEATARELAGEGSSLPPAAWPPPRRPEEPQPPPHPPLARPRLAPGRDGNPRRQAGPGRE